MIGLPYTQLAAINKNAASTEATRYYLNGVAVQVSGGRGWMVATDGHVMLCAPAVVPPETADVSVIIPSPAIASLKKSRADDVVKLSLGPDRAFTLDYADQIIGGKVIDGTFPDWRRVIPAEGYEPAPAAYDGSILAKMQAAAKALGGGWAVVTSNGPNPAYVRFPTGELFGVIMPLNEQSKPIKPLIGAKLPDWW